MANQLEYDQRQADLVWRKARVIAGDSTLRRYDFQFFGIGLVFGLCKRSAASQPDLISN